MDQVNLHDEGLLQGWKEDIDTLLVLVCHQWIALLDSPLTSFST